MSRKDFQLSRMANKKPKIKNKKRTLSGCVYNQNQTKPVMVKLATEYIFYLRNPIYAHL